MLVPSRRSPSRRLRSGLFLTLVGILAFPIRGAFAEDPKPADPTKPADPVKPADPAKPGDPAKPDPAVPPAAPGAPAQPAAPAEPPTPIAKAREELTRLKELLRKSKSDNADIIASLEEAAKIYHNLGPNDDAAKATFEKDKEDFQKDAEKLFIDAFDLVRVKPNTSANERDDVNIKGAVILGDCRPAVTQQIISSLETTHFKAKGYTPPTTLWDESFKAIGKLNDHKVGLPFVVDWLKYDNTSGIPDRIKAAFDGLLYFKEVPGKTRKDIVDHIIKTFVGVEYASDQNKSKTDKAQKQVWDRIKSSVVKALQAYCKEPKGKDGNLIATVKGFNDWFRDNDGPKNPAWVDVKVVGQAK